MCCFLTAAIGMATAAPLPAQRRKPPAKRPVPAKPASKETQPSVKVTLINELELKKVLTPDPSRPLLVNFWATWCDPCREEFPDLVELDREYKGKIDFITISLDDVENIATTVPKFLSSMRSEMPAYLLKTSDESGVIAGITTEWHGGMPFTALYQPDGKLAYFREGKVVIAKLKDELNKLLPNEGEVTKKE